MHSQNQLEHSLSIATNTLNFIREHAIIASPLVFSVLYAYFDPNHTSHGFKDYVDDNIKHEKDSTIFWEYCYEKFINPPVCKIQEIEEIFTKLLQRTDDNQEEILSELELLKQTSSKLEQQTHETETEKATYLKLNNEIKTLFNTLSNFSDKEQFFYDEMNKLRSELQNLQRELLVSNKKANYDHLTGLFNRRKLEEDVIRRLRDNRAHDCEKTFTFIIGDIDNFKRINDTHGHQIGDAFLIKFAKILSEIHDFNSITARFGGEEFVIFCETDKQGAFTIAERVRLEFSSKVFTNKATKETIGKVTASFGISAFLCTDTDIGDAFKRADACLYVAKKSGKNQVVIDQSA